MAKSPFTSAGSNSPPPPPKPLKARDIMLKALSRQPDEVIAKQVSIRAAEIIEEVSGAKFGSSPENLKSLFLDAGVRFEDAKNQGVQALCDVIKAYDEEDAVKITRQACGKQPEERQYSERLRKSVSNALTKLHLKKENGLLKAHMGNNSPPPAPALNADKV